MEAEHKCNLDFLKHNYTSGISACGRHRSTIMGKLLLEASETLEMFQTTSPDNSALFSTAPSSVDISTLTSAPPNSKV